MRNCVTFQNEGTLDPRAYRLFGASAKVNENPIGYFGTGLKYAIAVALRIGGRVELFNGTERVEFTARLVDMRDQEFEVVHAGDEELGYTTELGKNWEPWQAFRELWCNAMDEGGDVELGPGQPREGAVTIRLHHPDFVHCYNTRDRIMLQGKPRWFEHGIEVFERPSQHVYYRNIRVAELERPSRYTYNIIGHNMELTEDRTLKYGFMVDAYVRDLIIQTTEEDLVKGFLTAPQESFEAHCSLIHDNPSDLFIRVVQELPYRDLTSLSARACLVRVTGTKVSPRVREPSRGEWDMLVEAARVCRLLDIEVDPARVHVSTDLGDQHMGLCYNGELFIADRTFTRGQRQVTGTVFEEALHALRGLEDESREMQNYLLDRLIELAEERRS